MDENLNIKMLKPFSTYNVGEVCELDAPTAKSWIAAGLAEEVTASPEDALVDRLSKAMEDRDQQLEEKLVASITKAVGKTTTVTIPAVAKAKEQLYFPEFLNCVRIIDTKGHSHDEKQTASNMLQHKYVSKASTQVTTAGDLGGYLVPTEFRNDLVSLNPEKELIRPRALRIPTTTGDYEFPANNYREGLDGGTDCFWAGEIEAAKQTNLTFDKLKFTPHAIRSFISVSNKDLMVSPISVEAIIRQRFAQRIAKRFDKGFLKGTGAGMPRGILNSNAVLWVERETDGQVKNKDLATMFSLLPEDSHNDAVCIVSHSVYAQFLQLEKAAGSNLTWLPDMNSKPTMYLYGVPVIVSGLLAPVGQRGDILFMDMSKYVVVELDALTISVSDQVRWITSETCFKVEAYADGAPEIDYHIPIDDDSGNSYTSFFVGLEVYS